MAVNTDTVQFTVSVTGDTSGEKWYGLFKVKTRLSHRDQLQRDKVRRELLGTDGANASVRARDQAEIFSQLAVRVVDAPSWWRDNGNGLDLADDNLISEVYSASVKAEVDSLEAIKKAGEQAASELAAVTLPDTVK
jgi:hypothetical protein